MIDKTEIKQQDKEAAEFNDELSDEVLDRGECFVLLLFRMPSIALPMPRLGMRRS